MTISEIRSKYIHFFEKRGHAHIQPAPLVLENDPTTLFTSSGMQPLVPYLLGATHPKGKRLVDSQPSIRVQDIEEVGDNRHTTFFEMLGNWSLGDYFKAEQLPWIWEFLTDSKDGLGLSKEKLYISIFEGNDSVPRDEESYNAWIKLGVSPDHIFEYGVKKNWWSRSGTPEQMPEGEIGGPDSELFFDFGKELQLHENSQWSKEECNPNCDCGRFMEIGNSVFIQYKKIQDGKLEELPQKNVDFGGGLERLGAALNEDPDVFAIDVFNDVIASLEKVSGKSYEDPVAQRQMRIIADHLRAVVFMELYGTAPSNKGQGYVMRRLLRRAALKARELMGELTDSDIFTKMIEDIYVAYRDSYLHERNVLPVEKLVREELEKFMKTLEKGLREVAKIQEIDGKGAFDLYQTYGFPLELSIEIFQEKGQKINTDEFRAAFEEHQNKSRTASAGVFKGGLADHSLEVTRLHTATHLLHAALRKVLGDQVAQKGSNITAERLRFDFTHTDKLTPEEIKKIEEMMNEQIDKNLPVSFVMMNIDDARKSGAMALFSQKYDEQVKVYTIGDPEGEWFSKEVCGGPHVTTLSDLGGHVTITKEEASSTGVRRIYATVQ